MRTVLLNITHQPEMKLIKIVVKEGNFKQE